MTTKHLSLFAVATLLVASLAYATVTLVKADWSSGNLRYLDSSGNVIFTVDGTNRKLEVPSGSTLDIDAATVSFATGDIDTPELAADAVTHAKLDEGVEKFVDVTVTSAEVLALNATPITLVAAPGADQALIFEGAVLYKAAGTAYAAIAAGDDLAIKYTDENGIDVAVSEMTGFADSTSAQTRYIRPQTGALAAGTVSDFTPVANAALVAHMLTGEITTGDSDFLLRIYYRVVPTVLS